MIKAVKIAAALMLGLALTATATAGFAVYNQRAALVDSQGVENEQDPWMSSETPVSSDDVFNAENPEDVVEIGSDELPPVSGGKEPIAVGLAARWGFLDDPPVASMQGGWHLIDDTSGEFKGDWHVMGVRIHGTLWGVFNMAPDGSNGRLRGEWKSDDGRRSGDLVGSWERVDPVRGGVLVGKWSFSGGRPGGVFNGFWRATERRMGVFGGLAIGAPTMDMVPWDGFVKVDDGGVKLIREVRFEHGGEYRLGGDDKVLPPRETSKLAWRSSTTTNWDGLVMGILVPGPDVQVEFHTEQWSKTFTARELAGLHIRVPVDHIGHEIELKGFLIKHRRHHCGCEGDSAKVTLTLKWGYLDKPDAQMETMATSPLDAGVTTWDGFVQVTRGAVRPWEVLNWERGGDYKEGADDFIYPRNNILTVEWRSSTTDDWDGIVVQMCLPLRGGPMPNITVHTDQWSHIYSLDELRGLDQTYPVGISGQEVSVTAEVR